MSLTVIDLPDTVARAVEMSWQMEATHGRSESPFTGHSYAVAGFMERWRFSARFKNLSRADSAEAQAFFLQMEAGLHSFRMRDVSHPNLGVATGTPVLDGDHAARSRTVSITGATADVTNWLRAGDWIQIGNQFSKVIQDVDTDGSGNADVHIWPFLWEAHTDGAAVEAADPKGIFHLVGDRGQWTTSVLGNKRKPFEFGFAGVQTLPLGTSEVIEGGWTPGGAGDGSPINPAGWDIGAHEYNASGSSAPAEFDVVGAVYYAVAPAGYIYNSTQDTNYGARKYNTLTAAEADIAGTLAAPAVINIIGDWSAAGADTTAVHFSGATTSAANYVLVRTIGEARHGGVWSDGYYRLYVANASAMRVSYNHFRVDGLQIGKSASSANAQRGLWFDGSSTSGVRWVSNCIIRLSYSNAFYEMGIYVAGGAASDNKIWNCIVYGFGSPASTFGDAVQFAANASIYNCTVIGGYNCYNRATTVNITAKNCYGGNAVNENFLGTIAKTTCAVSDTDSDGNTIDNIPADATTFVNVTPGSEDFRLADGSLLIGEGTDTSGDAAPLDFTTDIAGKTKG